MAEKIPSWALPGDFPKKSLYDKYDMQRSWLTDTAETPEDQKNLKRDLQKLRKEYEAIKALESYKKTESGRASNAKSMLPKTTKKAATGVKRGAKTTSKATSKMPKGPVTLLPKRTTDKPGVRVLLPKKSTDKPGVRVNLSKPSVKRSSAKPVPLAPAPKRPAPTSTNRRPATPKTTKKAPGKMTPQDSAMKKILEKKYGKIYG